MQQILMMRTFCLGILSILLFACASSPQKTEKQKPYVYTAADSVYLHVFQPWDGQWEGIFSVYTDIQGQLEGEAQPRIYHKSIFDSLMLELSMEIRVKQRYESTSPFFQTVHIEDTYTEADGSIKTITSEGYNKVEGGKLLCLVNKPDEQVIHQGISYPNQSIIWERSIKAPNKIEYFFEKVENDTYYIIGWGYYGEDDPNLTPKTWFYGEYQRPGNSE